MKTKFTVATLAQLKLGGAIRVQLEKAGGAIFHEDWRRGQRAQGIETWLRPVGNDKFPGTEWMAAHPERVVMKDGVPHVDLMKHTYAELPPRWQDSNDGTAKFLVKLVSRYLIWSGGKITAEMKRQMDSFLHANWALTQIDWAKEEPDAWPQMFADGNHREFEQLPKAQQDKDSSMVSLVLDEALRLLNAA